MFGELMPLVGEKFVEFNGLFYTIKPGIGTLHMVYRLDKYGMSKRVSYIHTKDLPKEVIELIKKQAPWVKLKT